MPSRYDNRKVYVNNNEMYRELFRKRGVNFIRHYETAILKFPTAEQIANLQLLGHIWKHGDALWKLAQSQYGDPTLWWVIAQWNQKIDIEIKLGDTIYIPHPLERVLQCFEG
jgi:hypothetical protein